MAAVRTFSDLDLNFSPNPVTGDVNTLTDVDAIKASVRNLVLTQNYERPFHPEIGSAIRALLFEPWSVAVKTALQRTIAQMLQNYEPRITVNSVDVTDQSRTNSLAVAINFTIVNTMLPVSTTVILYRSR